MGIVFKYIRDFYRKDLNWMYLIIVMLLMSGMIYLNYWHHLEIKYARGGEGWARHFAGYYLLYFTPFAAAFLLQLIFYKGSNYFHNKWFWAILFIAPAIFSFRVNFSFHQSILQNIWQGDALKYWSTCISLIVRVFAVLAPIFIIWYIKDKNNQPFYGSAKLTNVRPYMYMLLIMVPLIILASTQPDFLHTYPKAKFISTTIFGGQWWRYLVYELCYGFDFISIEFFFRGFLILSLINICGSRAIIPVASFYCAIHLGKPMGEAVSSFFGGMLLGIVTLNTRSIWGGLIVHLGIAWLMEAGGWAGSIFQGKRL